MKSFRQLSNDDFCEYYSFRIQERGDSVTQMQEYLCQPLKNEKQ